MATAAAFEPRFLIISLGNPGQHYNSLHSAGHMVLNAIQHHLQGTQPAFRTERFGKKSSLSSVGAKYIMVQSPTFMNTSGSWVAKTWKDSLTEQRLSPKDLGLVLLHDDLEEDLGVVKIRKWERSHRGHNGVKSVNASLRHADYKASRWARISVGIGRPGSREQSTVSDYVLRPLSGHQKSALTDKAAPAVLQALLELEEQWEKDFTKENSSTTG